MKKKLLIVLLICPIIFSLFLISAIGINLVSNVISASQMKKRLINSCPKTYSMEQVPKNTVQYDLYMKNLNLSSEQLKHDRHYIEELRNEHLGFYSLRNLELAKRLGDDVSILNRQSFMGSLVGGISVYFDKNGDLLYLETKNITKELQTNYCRYSFAGKLIELSYWNNEDYYTFNSKGRRIFSCYKYECEYSEILK